MPDKKCQNYGENPFAIPEPYYLPGYTGHCPKYYSVIGESYGRATHTAMQEEPVANGRLRPLPQQGQWLGCYPPNLEPEDIQIMEKRQSMEGKSILKEDIASGYKGHIPRASQLIGLTFKQSCIKGVADFEKRRQILEEKLKEKTRSE